MPLWSPPGPLWSGGGLSFRAALRADGERVARAPTHSRDARKALGAFYTPAPIVRDVLDRTLGPVIGRTLTEPNPVGALLALRVLDPACGDGAFLAPAAERIIDALARVGRPGMAQAVVERCVVGVDVDPLAADACAEALRELAGGAVRVRIIVADALREGPALFGDERFDAVVGNPPYLNQLERTTATPRDAARAIRAWSGGLVKGYADAAAAFWLLACRTLREGGRCGLVLPRSILSTRDAAPVRREIAGAFALESVWFDDRPMFDACVRVCAPVVARGEAPSKVVRTRGELFEPLPDAAPPAPPHAERWSHLLPEASEAPAVVVRTGRTLADIAEATADFRDQYYGLRGCIVEHDEAARRAPLDDLEDRFPRLITSGLIDRDACLWGVRPARILKRAWWAPRLDRVAFEAGTDLAPWLRARLTPKVLLATQTRVLEPLLDERGSLVPVVPVITITPKRGVHDPADTLRVIHTSLRSASATATALRLAAGAALSPGAIKLSAKQVLSLPIVEPGAPEPDEVRAWFERRLAVSDRPRGTSPCGRPGPAASR